MFCCIVKLFAETRRNCVVIELILGSLVVLQVFAVDCVRRRPFLVKKLENVLIKLLKSLEFFEQDGRKKLAIGEQGQRLLQGITLS